MPEPRFPTQDEFWRRLDRRKAETDLRDGLKSRASQVDGAVKQLGRASTVTAFVAQLLPGSAVPASVIAQFLDEHFTEAMGRADEKASLMPRAQRATTGFIQLDEAAGGDFSSLPAQEQQDLMGRAERGEL